MQNLLPYATRILKECDINKYNLSSLRIVRTGAAAFDASMAKEAEDRLNCKVLIAGGCQETYSFAQTGVDDPGHQLVGQTLLHVPDRHTLSRDSLPALSAGDGNHQERTGGRAVAQLHLRSHPPGYRPVIQYLSRNILGSRSSAYYRDQ